MSNEGGMPSPDPVTLVLEFLNTLDVEDHTDSFGEARGFEEWSRQHLGVAAGELTRRDWQVARRLRNTLRTAVGGSASQPSDTAVPLEMRVASDGTVSLSGATPAEMVAAAVAELALSDRWSRIKICPADDCQWAFFDKSRNQSRQWCSMAVCGNRAKARAHRQRVS
jgi:predicted RNA-binding Zn ribbon-like protein